MQLYQVRLIISRMKTNNDNQPSYFYRITTRGMHKRRLWIITEINSKKTPTEVSLKERYDKSGITESITMIEKLTEMLRSTTNLTALQRIQIGKRMYYIQVKTSFPSCTITQLHYSPLFINQVCASKQHLSGLYYKTHTTLQTFICVPQHWNDTSQYAFSREGRTPKGL